MLIFVTVLMSNKRSRWPREGDGRGCRLRPRRYCLRERLGECFPRRGAKQIHVIAV